MNPLNYDSNCNIMIIGVGLMGQYMARHVSQWLDVSQLVLVDANEDISVNGNPMPLKTFAAGLNSNTVAETTDVRSEEQVSDLFKRYPNIRYLMYTAGISPRPLVPPEALTKEDVMNACEVNLWGAHNVIKQGIQHSGFSERSHAVLILSTSATVGSEGRASAAYEESKGGLLNLLTLQSRYFLEEHGIQLNGLAPSPLRGPMAAQNPISADRLQAVEDTMPIGSLTTPEHIAAATMYFWSNECWCVGEVLTTDGGYTKHQPIYGPL